jgi:hypothetical protein
MNILGWMKQTAENLRILFLSATRVEERIVNKEGTTIKPKKN